MALRGLSPGGLSLPDMLREEAAARRAVQRAAALDRTAEDAADRFTRKSARQGALAARRRAIHRRLRFYEAPADLAARLEAWAEETNDAAVLDRLIAALAYTDAPPEGGTAA